MLNSICKRIVLLFLTVAVATSVLFMLIHASGDPTQGFLAPGSPPEVREATRERLGLDDPIVEQYVRFLGRGLTGDFGESWRNREPALEAVIDRLPATLLLASLAIAIAVTGGIGLGLASAWMGSGLLRSTVRLVAMMGQAIPAFWLGTLGILVFAVNLRWLPASGNEDWRALILPAFTLAAYPGSLIARLIQTSLIDVSTRPFIVQAHAKGLGSAAIWIRHTLPNALLPALAIIGLQASFLVGGAIVVEAVFAYPGLGRLAMQATTERDVPIIQAFVTVTIVLVSLVNLTVDLIASMIDPTQRSGQRMAHSHG
jgi:peptide/nickel transport system permease protein